MYKYHNRSDAGRKLAALLQAYHQHPNAIVLALPRGGVPVAYEIAKNLRLPLTVFIVRKLGVPEQPELALGAIATGNICLFNHPIIQELNINTKTITAVIEKEQIELQRRMERYCGKQTALAITGKIIILIDDGIATGATIKAAIKAIALQNPKKIIVSIPVADPGVSQEIASLVAEYHCPLQPENLIAVGAWYEDFSQTQDEEVTQLLQNSLKVCGDKF